MTSLERQRVTDFFVPVSAQGASAKGPTSINWRQEGFLSAYDCTYYVEMRRIIVPFFLKKDEQSNSHHRHSVVGKISVQILLFPSWVSMEAILTPPQVQCLLARQNKPHQVPTLLHLIW